MPRIRKKTSKRVAIHHREKIKHKVKETRKKKSKAARKNVHPQWKSKHPKDPGIPSAFPYKDQILAEVAEERRAAAEAKQRRKEEKKAVKAGAAGGDGAEAEAEAEAEAGDGYGSDAGDAFDGVRALSGQRARDVGDATGGDQEMGDVEGDEDEEDEEGAPVLANPELPNLKAVLGAADVLVEVLDARDPAASRSAHLEEVARGLGKRVLLVLNKVDACPREAVEAWAAVLRRECPTVLFRSATVCLPAASTTDAAKGKGKAKERADDAWGLDSVISLLQQWANDKDGDKPLTVAVAGVTNVGKSSFVNSLLRKATLQTYRLTSTTVDSPTTTTYPQEVTIGLEGGKQVRIIDTPGISWHPVEDASPEDVARLRARDILLRNRGHIERLKDPSPVLSELASRATREDLMLMYNLPIFADGDSNAFLAGVARANGYIKKKGELDLAGAARMVLRDWSNGKLARFTLPSLATDGDGPVPAPVPVPASPDASLAALYAKDDALILPKLSTRKELRKAGGVVKLRAGAPDARTVVLDASYFVDDDDDEGNEGDAEDAGTVDDADDVGVSDGLSEGDYVSDAEEGSSEDDGGGSEGEEDDEGEDEGGDEDELASPPPHGKRKRVPAKAPARPAKRVAFAPEPRGTKQARSAAGVAGVSKAKTKTKASSSAKGARDKSEPKTNPAKKVQKASAPRAAPIVAKKLANASSRKSAGAGEDGEAAYDFKQFF